MTDMDRLPLDANAKVERWMVSHFRRTYRDSTGFPPIGKTCAHLLRCPQATCGPVAGGDEDISYVTAGGMVHLEATISCPHEEDQFRHLYYDRGDLADVLAELDDPESWQIGPVAELPAYLEVRCSIRCGFGEFHRIHIGTTTVWARCGHSAYLTVVRDGVVVEKRQIPSGERYGVVLE